MGRRAAEAIRYPLPAGTSSVNPQQLPYLLPTGQVHVCTRMMNVCSVLDGRSFLDLRFIWLGRNQHVATSLSETNNRAEIVLNGGHNGSKADRRVARTRRLIRGALRSPRGEGARGVSRAGSRGGGRSRH